MRGLINRTAAFGLSVTLALGAAAVPCAGGELRADKMSGPGGKLTRLSPASRQVLAARPALVQQTSGPSSPGPFFKSTRGKVTLVLMSAGTVLTIWSISHDRKPVKSPIR